MVESADRDNPEIANMEALFYGAIRQALLIAYRNRRKITWDDIQWLDLHKGIHMFNLPKGANIVGLNELEGLALGDEDTTRKEELRCACDNYMAKIEQERQRRKAMRKHRTFVENCRHCSCHKDSGRECCHCGKGKYH